MTGEWASVLERLFHVGGDEAAKLLLTFQAPRSMATQAVMNDVKRECIGLCSSNKQSLFGNTSAESLAKWSPSEQEQELHIKAPIFLTFLESAGTPRSITRNKTKKMETVRNGILAAAAVILKTRNKNMNAYQTMISFALKQGGAGEKTFRRLHALGMCDSYQVLSHKLDQYSVGYDEPLQRWQEEMLCDAEQEREILKNLADLTGQIADGGDLLVLEPLKHKLDSKLAEFQVTRHPGYQVVGDNVDMRILVRFMLMMAQDREIHHFNHLAIMNRVNAHHLPDDQPICSKQDFQPSLILPNGETNATLRSNWIVLIGHIIAKYLPQLRWITDYLPKDIPHRHQDEARKKSETVSKIFEVSN